MSFFDDNENRIIYGPQGKYRSGRTAGGIMMAKRLADTRVMTGRVRLSYAHLFEPVAIQEGQEKKYSVSLLVPKTDTGTIKMINEAIEKAVQVGIAQKWGGKRPKNLKLPLRDGDQEREDETYEGMMFVNANNKRKPGILDKYKTPVDDPEEVYSGCYALASISFFAYSASGNNGVGCSIDNIMKVDDGDPLGNVHTAASDFADIELDDDGLD